MPDSSLHDLAQVLHSKLESARTLDAADRASLQRLATDLNTILAERDRGSDAGHAGVLEQLRDATTRFEVSHPDLTATLVQVSKALGDMGI